jgi:multiple sugar transport system permease protein
MMFGLCFLILQPILNKISVSFMAEQDLYNTMVVNIPANFTTANYELAAQFMGYGEALRIHFSFPLPLQSCRYPCVP